MQKEQLTSEIANLIIDNPSKVSQRLRASGVRVTPLTGDKKLAQLTAKQLAKGDTKFITGIAKDITGRYDNVDGDTPKVSGGIDPVSAVAGAIGSIFSFASSGQQQKIQEEQNEADLTLAMINAKMEQEKREARSRRNTLLLVGGILLAVFAVIGFIVYKKYR